MEVQKNIPDNYSATLAELKQKINAARYRSMVAVNTEMILTYIEIGKTIAERVKTGWGNSVIDKLSIDLQAEYNGVEGFSARNLRRMKLIYEEISDDNPIWPQVVAKIPWGHTSLIFSKIKNKDQRIFYLQKTAIEGWSRSILEEKIKFDEYSKHLNSQNNLAKTIDSNEIAQYSQQLNWYLHLLDKTVKYPGDNTSIGILLCKSKSKITVDYALELVNHPMGVATYTYSQLPKEIAQNLPNEQEFKNILLQNFEE